MTVYIFLFTALFLFRYILKNTTSFCVVSGILLYLVVALRNINLGLTDTSNIYLPNYNWIKISNLHDIVNGTLSSGSILFNVITKGIQQVSLNYQVYLALIAIPYIVAIVFLIAKYSTYKLLSFIFFISFYYLFSFFLLRQVIAISFVIFSFKYLNESKPVKFLILIISASLFHSSAIFFVIAYPFCKFIKFGKKNFVFILIAYIVAKLCSNNVLYLISSYMPTLFSYVKNGVYGTSGQIFLTNLLVNVILLMIIYTFNKESDDKEYNTICNLVTLGSILICFTPIVTEFYRLALYFNVFDVLLISQVFVSVSSKIVLDKKIVATVYIILLFSLITYFFIRTINNVNANPYMFFWVINI